MSIQPTIAYHAPVLPVVPRGRRQVQVALACFALAALGSLYLLGGAGRHLAIGLAGLTAVGLTLWDIRIGLGLFLLLAGLSPEFSVHAGATLDNLRAEDFLFPVLLMSWLVRILVHRERPDFRTPLTAPMVVITLWGLSVTLLGLFVGTVPHGSTALFRFVKYTQYYLIFFLVTNNVRTLRDARALATVVIAAAVLTTLFSSHRGATAWQESGEAFARASGPSGENYNTLAGYLVQAFGVATALALSSRGRAWRLSLGLAAATVAAGILFTHSREGYVMLAAVGAFLAGRRYRVLIPLGVLLALVGPMLLPASVRHHMGSTVHQLQSARTDDPGSNSMSARLYGWRSHWRYRFLKQPIHGHGVGSISFTVDNQYLLTLVETGLVGFGLFLWLLARLWRFLAQAERALPHSLAGVLATGTLGALVGLVVQGAAATSFGTVRTMEPWWFLAGLAFAAVRAAGPGNYVTMRPWAGALMNGRSGA